MLQQGIRDLQQIWDEMSYFLLHGCQEYLTLAGQSCHSVACIMYGQLVITENVAGVTE